MTSGAAFTTSSPAGDDWLACSKSAMSLVVSSLTEAPFAQALEAVEAYRGELDAVEALLIAQRTAAGFSPTSTETILKQSGKVSKNEAKKRTTRAKASQGDRDSRYAGQRRRRKVYKIKARNGMSRLIVEGDDESVDAMLLSLKKKADASYRKDGGRDVPVGEHPRTNNQRLYDAAHHSITGTPDVDTGKDTDVDVDEAVGGSPASSSSAATKSASKSKPPGNKPGDRPVMVFRSNLADVTEDPVLLAQWTAELIGTGKIPSTLASYYRCISDFAVQITSEDGIVLKHGRTKRRATPEQWIALVARDSACVRCSAHHTRCEAHHLIPWTARTGPERASSKRTEKAKRAANKRRLAKKNW